ncbi:DUF1801 domain-containing protein [Homoserinibacter sp. GY 40078]|uniref:DUF1801 domain-containing protein n=1 Tax=Homoserinibacter sp. GY 40078 TaxID=2603275 RepID=UPI001C9BCF22|nr:DUF1801 domain-containing protein [Homoserinibacter sp. GY 40078]
MSVEIAELLSAEIDRGLPEAANRVWHGHPVWFLDGNPIVGYHRLKDAMRLMFWSGQSFDEPGLRAEGSFQAAEARYTDVSEVDVEALRRWIAKSREIQWDYEHIRQARGVLQKRTAF